MRKSWILTLVVREGMEGDKVDLGRRLSLCPGSGVVGDGMNHITTRQVDIETTQVTQEIQIRTRDKDEESERRERHSLGVPDHDLFGGWLHRHGHEVINVCLHARSPANGVCYSCVLLFQWFVPLCRFLPRFSRPLSSSVTSSIVPSVLA